MAAAEYYFGTQNQNRPSPYLPPPQQQQLPPPPSSFPYKQIPPQSNAQLQNYNTPPPSYSPYTPPQQYQQQLTPQQQLRPLLAPQYQQWPMNDRPSSSVPYSQTPPQAQQNGFLGVPLMPQRSYSQPPRVHFAKHDDYDDTSDRAYDSDSDASHRRHRRHDHHRSHSHSRRRSYDDDYDDHDDRDRSYNNDRHDRTHRKERKDRDTFLGAGAGGIIGDAIFPGLGTAAGLLIGGYGGRHHAKKRSRSAAATDGEEYRGRSGHHKGGSGWDEESATYKSGWAVR